MPSIPELEAIRKKQILEAVQDTMANIGYHNLTMGDIAEAANLSKGGLAYYFKSKKKLFKSVFQEFFDQVFKKSKELMDQYSNPVDKLLAFDFLYDENNKDTMRGWPIIIECMSIVLHDEEFRGIFHNWVNNWAALKRQAIEDAIDQDLLSPEIDPDDITKTISAIYQGIGTRWYLDRDNHTTQWALNAFKLAINNLLEPYKTKKCQELASLESKQA